MVITQGPATTLRGESPRAQSGTLNKWHWQPGAPKTGDHGLQCSGSTDPNRAFSKHRYCEPCGNHRLYVRHSKSLERHGPQAGGDQSQYVRIHVRPLVATGKRRFDARRFDIVQLPRFWCQAPMAASSTSKINNHHSTIFDPSLEKTRGQSLKN